MAEFQWDLDVADGVLKNHALSPKIREAAVAATVISPFCPPESGYGRKKGDSLTVTLIKNISEPTSAALQENQRIPIDTYAQTSVTVTVGELGRGVEYTHKTELLSHYDLENRIQRKLKQQLALVLDTAAATAFKTAGIIFQPTTLAGGTFTTTGTPAVTALVNGTVQHLKVIRDYLADTIHCPPYEGQDFIGLCSTKFLRGIRNDPEFQAWMAPQHASDAFFSAWAGKVENIRLVEVNHTQALSNAKGSGSVLGEALIFGEDAVCQAWAEDPELRVALAGDFGRQKAVAWYGVGAFKCLWGTSANDGEARIVRVTSA